MEVIDILKSRVPSNCAQTWCEDLLRGDVDCKRLALCLAIELRRQAEEVLLLEHLEKIFEDCDYDHQTFESDSSKSWPRVWFELKRKKIKNLYCKVNECILPTTDPLEASENENIYVTTLDFYALATYYLNREGCNIKIKDNNNPEDVIELVTEHPDFIDYAHFFGDIHRPSPVWVTTKEELDRIKKINPSYNEATNIFNCLGLRPRASTLELYPNTGNMYFCVEYPLPAGITAYQPSSLNRNWSDAKSDLFLSYVKKDSFGLTYASDASGAGAKEQIHEPLKNVKGLKISLLGRYDSIEVNKSAILDVAEKRLKS